MQSDLIARGLLTKDLRLTDAGNAYVDDLIAQLKSGVAPAPAKRGRVKWRRRVGPKPPNIDNQHAGLDAAGAGPKIAPVNTGPIPEGVSC